SMPAVLVELDFICNPESVKYMTSEKGEDKFAESLFNSIKKFVDRRK
ncbi:MAG: N-acetylmuramoyl-L-alanine amidase, partial [Muribaculaceae bacterium]|nr:N-acetylmuramoyl-L-alanine amidase [Muribaculaceae bacterium]